MVGQRRLTATGPRRYLPGGRQAEQGLRTLQREHAELAARGRTLAGEEEQHRRLREAVGEWHTGWMEVWRRQGGHSFFLRLTLILFFPHPEI